MLLRFLYMTTEMIISTNAITTPMIIHIVSLSLAVDVCTAGVGIDLIGVVVVGVVVGVDWMGVDWMGVGVGVDWVGVGVDTGVATAVVVATDWLG